MPESGPTSFDVATDQILGTRAEQQDTCKIVPWGKDAVLCILADGMGGHVGGAQASEIAVQTFVDKFRDANARNAAERLDDALYAANDALAQEIDREPALGGMGCTLIGALVAPNRLTWISVGDSLLFLHTKCGLRRLNADHSGRVELQAMVEAGELTPHEARSDNRRNMLLSALTGDEIAMIDRNEIPLQAGQRILLASDGIETLENEEITDLLVNKNGSADVLHRIMEAIEARGMRHQDNTTCILLASRPDGKSGYLSNPKTFDIVTTAIITTAITMLTIAAGLFLLGSASGG